jgi:hypothetical protein
VASTLTDVIELLVGLACIGLGAAVRSRMRAAAVLMVAAGLVAAVHAVVGLV